MKLLNLPILALQIITRQMDPHEVFLLSLLSLRANNRLKSIRFPPNSIWYDCVFANNTLKFALEEMVNDYDDIVFECFGTPRANLKVEPFLMNINGKKIRCRVSVDWYGTPTLWLDESIRDSISMSIHSHIVELFNSSTDFQLRVDLENQHDLPNVPILKNVHFLSVGVEVVMSSHYLYAFFERYTVTNRAIFECRMDGELLEDNVLEIDHLFIDDWADISEDNLINFNGIIGTFVFADIYTENIIEFINSWLDGNNTKLKLMIVMPFNHHLIDDAILPHFETLPFDPRRRPEKIPMPDEMEFCMERAGNVRSRPQRLLDYTGVDIIRKSDGCLATIVLEGGSFAFFVWGQSNEQRGQNVKQDE
uniref:F-box domain-containing protein n=2 Tax=Caenorhabditis tropicalis TaxID=1561998 RepID=A0A1I7UWZ1_9PELO